MKGITLTPLTKIALIIGVVAVAWYFMPSSWFGGSESDPSAPISESEKSEVIKVGVVTWGGYSGGQYFNEGFKANKNSRFYKEYGILVEFVLIDDFNDSRNAWKSGNIDLLWATADAFPTEAEGLKQFEPQIIFQSDWSRGGDAIVVRRGINSVSDLKGKKIAVAPMTPSHTFLLNLFEAGEISMNDVQVVEVANAIDAADLFKKDQVDAAVVWSPDDQDCVTKIEGSKVLMSTKTANYIIADVFIAKKEYVEKNKEKLAKLIEGWMKGAAEINSSEEAKKKAAKILSEGLNQPEDFCYSAINNARLCTYGDNVNFFNINGNYDGVTGEDLYSNMSSMYSKVGYAQNPTSWRNIADPDLIKMIKLSGTEHSAETSAKFTAATEEEKHVSSISTKKVKISFSTGSYTLDDNAKYIIDKEFGDIARSFSNARIRIEGNTDNVGNAQMNKDLSYKRAKAVADYLQSEFDFDPNRFIIVGNGQDSPVANNSTEEGRAQNRRTDFELLPQ